MSAPVATSASRVFVRPSALGVAEYCPRAVGLSEQVGIGREAVMSTVWHAICAGNSAALGELPPAERAEVASWAKPADVTIELDGVSVVLDYESAEKELHVQVQERNTLITEGTLDFAWPREVRGRRWAFVADLKRSTWAISDGPDCLQLAAYGHAYAALRNCEGYTPGLWSGTEGEWTWGTPVDLTSPDALDVWQRLKRAARNDARLMPEGSDKARAVTGDHCRSCYGRMRCSEYVALAHTGEAMEVTSQNAATLALQAKAMADMAALISSNVKTFAERGGVVQDPTSGKRYLPVMCKGRKSLDQEAVAKALSDHGLKLEAFMRRGKPYAQFDWRRA